jgi:hypothetical protein
VKNLLEPGLPCTVHQKRQAKEVGRRPRTKNPDGTKGLKKRKQNRRIRNREKKEEDLMIVK